MAVSPMAKVMIVSHRSEASELLEALQAEGICQILPAEEAAVARDNPDLAVPAEPPRDIEQTLTSLNKAITFLKDYSQAAKGLSMLAPRVVVDEKAYSQAVSDEQIPRIIEQAERCSSSTEQARGESEKLLEILDRLEPWKELETAVEKIAELQSSSAFTGLLGTNHVEPLAERLVEFNGAIQLVGTSGNRAACIVVCLKESSTDVQKLLRGAEFEPVSFEGMTGTVVELIGQYSEKLRQTQAQLDEFNRQGRSLGKQMLKLQILDDHYSNLLERQQAESKAPATVCTAIFEGWVKRKDYSKLEKIVSGFGASTVSKVEPAKGEEPPVEIENRAGIRPFEVITRLYGMPQHFEVDPTVFLMPFFALFFALCLTDAGYGLVIIALMAFFIKKAQGDTKLMWMLGICSVFTVVAGALTGGWFGDAVQQFIPALGPLRKRMMWFDPLDKPMTFFALALGLGYFQILTGLMIAFIHNLKRKDYIAAVCDQLTWLVMLNSIVIFLAGKAGYVSAGVGGGFGKLALVPAAAIFLFSEREGSLAGRLGMGAYNLFSTIFYMGDVLSYLRLMALGMVTAGLAMAINVIAKIALNAPYGIGIVVMILVLVCGHGFNLALSALSAFVHTLRLQYVEFFPKFLVGGGKLFEPLSRKYKHIYMNK